MATWTNDALKKIMDGDLDLGTDTLKVMLVDDDFVFDPDVSAVDPDDDSVNDAHHHEIVATNYTGGYEGAGRKTAAIGAAVVDDTNDGAYCVIDDITWTALGGVANDTVGMALLIQEITDDPGSLVIAALDITDFLTNGSDFLLKTSTGVSDGVLRLRNA